MFEMFKLFEGFEGLNDFQHPSTRDLRIRQHVTTERQLFKHFKLLKHFKQYFYGLTTCPVPAIISVRVNILEILPAPN